MVKVNSSSSRATRQELVQVCAVWSNIEVTVFTPPTECAGCLFIAGLPIGVWSSYSCKYADREGDDLDLSFFFNEFTWRHSRILSVRPSDLISTQQPPRLKRQSAYVCTLVNPDTVQMLYELLAFCWLDIRELKQQRRQRQRKRDLKINIWEMLTILWLLLLPGILSCWQNTLQMDWYRSAV